MAIQSNWALYIFSSKFIHKSSYECLLDHASFINSQKKAILFLTPQYILYIVCFYSCLVCCFFSYIADKLISFFFAIFINIALFSISSSLFCKISKALICQKWNKWKSNPLRLWKKEIITDFEKNRK